MFLLNSYSIEAVEDVIYVFSKKHILVGIILREFPSLLLYKERSVRFKAISILKNLLERHDKDERYQVNTLPQQTSLISSFRQKKSKKELPPCISR